MKKEPRVVMLTSNGLRHRAAAQRLARSVNLLGIVSESKAPVVADPALLLEQDRLIIERHFHERDAVETRLLGQNVTFPDTQLLSIAQGSINSSAVNDWVRRQNADLLVLYGTGLLKDPLLSDYEGRIVNLHLGLSPYYRGSGTNFWPLVNRQPEYVGGTIHLAVANVDAGGILLQVRPAPEVSDRAHDLGTKTIMAGFDAMPKVLSLYLEGKMTPQRQDLSSGRVFKRKDFHAGAVRTMLSHFASGMMEEYLRDADNRRRQCPIVELPEQFSVSGQAVGSC